MSRKALLLLPGLLACLSWPAAAGIVCCDVNGQRVCGDPPPPQCDARPKTVYGKGGVARPVEAPPTAEQRAAREAETALRKTKERKAIEQARRDRALLDSYTNEREIDAARDRAIADVERNAEQAQNRLENALTRKEKLDQERELHQKKPLPAHLVKQIEANDTEIAAQQKALKQKEADIAALGERYAADKQRYLQLRGQAARK